MTHLFSEEEWNDYIEGRIDDETRDRIEAHIIGCLSCWEFHERMATATRALVVCGAGMRVAFALVTSLFARFSKDWTRWRQ